MKLQLFNIRGFTDQHLRFQMSRPQTSTTATGFKMKNPCSGLRSQSAGDASLRQIVHGRTDSEGWAHESWNYERLRLMSHWGFLGKLKPVTSIFFGKSLIWYSRFALNPSETHGPCFHVIVMARQHQAVYIGSIWHSFHSFGNQEIPTDKVIFFRGLSTTNQ